MRLSDQRYRIAATAAATAAVFLLGMFSASTGGSSAPSMLESRVAALERSKEALRANTGVEHAAVCSCPPSVSSECPVLPSSSPAAATPSPDAAAPGNNASPSPVPSPWSAEWAGGSAAVERRRETCDDCACKPFLSGQVDPARPPYFFPDAANQCSLRHFTPTEGLECVRGRRIFILGNSIARGFGFQIMVRRRLANLLKQLPPVCCPAVLLAAYAKGHSPFANCKRFIFFFPPAGALRQC